MTQAVLALADGTVFEGVSVGVEGKIAVGEVVFNTSMTGYQEILTDPSYAFQLVALTCCHIGNTGVNTQDMESSRVFASGLIIRDASIAVSNYRAQGSLANFLMEQQVVAIAEIDTRALTHLLRDKGAQAGVIMVGQDIDIPDGIKMAREFSSIAGKDLVRLVTCQKPYFFKQKNWFPSNSVKTPSTSLLHPTTSYKVVVYDFGVKKQILCALVDQGCEVVVIPATTSVEDALAYQPDGILLSNGPGDPQPCDYAIKTTQMFLERGLPVLGICLGHQLLGLALGAPAEKNKFKRHGTNHPLLNKRDGRVWITSQNHGFVVDEESLPDDVEVTHLSLFDGSLQGMRLKNKPVFSFQGHPEASPGPQESSALFNQFIDLMTQYREKK